MSMNIVLFNSSLCEVGGEERLMLEHARFLKSKGYSLSIITLFFHPDVLSTINLDIPVTSLTDQRKPRKLSITEKICLIFKLRKKFRQIRPDLVIGQLTADIGIIYLATLFTNIKYVTYIHGTIMWFPEEKTKYSLIHRRKIGHLIEQVPGHKTYISKHDKSSTFMQVVGREFNALLRYLGVGKAGKVFTLSRLMANEIKCLYGKPAIVLKGAYGKDIFNHEINYSIKNDLSLPNDKRLILNINRLDKRKRVDTLIKSFSIIEKQTDDTYLAIGGKGEEEDYLRKITGELGLKRVIFLGFVPEEKLLDYYATCDLFAHPNWAEYAITVYEALAMGCRVVCSSEMEFDPELLEYSQIYRAYPSVDNLSAIISTALDTPNNKPIPGQLLERYTWNNYFQKIDHQLYDSLRNDSITGA